MEGNAPVVVALFGKEHSPEMVVELGAALADREKLQVLHLTEVPEQTLLDAALEEDVAVRSLRRRVMALGEDRAADIEFHAVLSRDLGQTVLSATAKVGFPRPVEPIAAKANPSGSDPHASAVMNRPNGIRDSPARQASTSGITGNQRDRAIR